MTFFHQRALVQLSKLANNRLLCQQNGNQNVVFRHASTLNKDKTATMDKYIQVLPIIKLSPSYPNGKILLGNWKYGNYKGRYTGVIEKLAQEASSAHDQFESALENFAKALVPAEIREYVSGVKCHGVLEFDGPPDSLEYVCVASINSLVDIQNHKFTNDYPYHLEWFDINRIPFDKMPADDRIWYPPVIHGKLIRGSFHFGGLEERELKSYELSEVKDLEL